MKSLLVPAIVATCLCPRLCFSRRSSATESRMCIHEEDLKTVTLSKSLDKEINAAFSAALMTNNQKAIELIMQQLYKIFSHRVRSH